MALSDPGVGVGGGGGGGYGFDKFSIDGFGSIIWNFLVVQGAYLSFLSVCIASGLRRVVDIDQLNIIQISLIVITLHVSIHLTASLRCWALIIHVRALNKPWSVDSKIKKVPTA